MKLFWSAVLLLALIGAVGSTIWFLANSDSALRYLKLIVGWGVFAGALILFCRFREAAGAREQPVVWVNLVQVGGFDEQLRVENASEVDAFDVDVKFLGGEMNPMPAAVSLRYLPIKVLSGRTNLGMPVSLTTDTHAEFDVVWTWKDRRGKQFKKREWISLTRA